MTHEDWLQLLAPVISALVLAAAGLLSLVLSGLTGRLKAYLDAKGQAEASKLVTDASTRVQAAMQNAAGQIALEIQTGRLDPLNLDQLKAAAAQQAEAVARKLPDALIALRPAAGAVAEGILGKITQAAPAPGAAAPAPVVVAVPPPAPAAPHSPDRKAFYDAVRASVFGNRITDEQFDGMERILNFWNAFALAGDVRHLAYILATVAWETSKRMDPIREFGRGEGHDYGTTGLYGRGLVQITHEDNYRRMSAIVGVDLVANPDAALDWPVALKILFAGMARGMFTGKKLADYFNATTDDPMGARRIVNGTDRAKEIAAYHEAFLAGLRAV